MSSEPPHTRIGVIYGVIAYGAWGTVPLFWKLLTGVPAVDTLAHRIIWAGLSVFLLLIARGRGHEVVRALRDRRVRRTLFGSGALLAGTWLLFVYAVFTDRVLHASLGYFINPLVSMMLGIAFLGERLRPAQWLAVGCASAGVVVMTTTTGGLPWISLTLASGFGLYGYLRKTVRVDALPGNAVETLFMLPFALIFLGHQALWDHQETLRFGQSWRLSLLLMATGPVTALPLLWFTNAARRVSLTTLGFLQYLAPTGHFILAVAVYGEPFGNGELVSFALIWLGLALFSADSLRRSRR